jgi:hypothetical protein
MHTPHKATINHHGHSSLLQGIARGAKASTAPKYCWCNHVMHGHVQQKVVTERDSAWHDDALGLIHFHECLEWHGLGARTCVRMEN